MIEYSRGDVEFLAMELFHSDYAGRSWETSDYKRVYRVRAKSLLDEECIALPIVEVIPKVVVKRKPRALKHNAQGVYKHST